MKKLIENEKIRLSNIEKFRYYRVPILFFIITLFSFTDGFTKLPFENLNLSDNPVDKIGAIALLGGLLTYYHFNNNLKVKISNFKYNKPDLIIRIENSIEFNEDWYLIEKTDNYFIIETKENAETVGGRKNPLISPNMGNRIYIGLEPKKYFVKVLFNLSNKNFLVLNNGECKRNEKIIINLIKSTENKV